MEVSPKGGGLLLWHWGIIGCSVFPSKAPLSTKAGKGFGMRSGSKGYSRNVVQEDGGSGCGCGWTIKGKDGLGAGRDSSLK